MKLQKLDGVVDLLWVQLHVLVEWLRHGKMLAAPLSLESYFAPTQRGVNTVWGSIMRNKIVRIAAAVFASSVVMAGVAAPPAHAAVEKSGGALNCSRSQYTVSLRAHGSETIEFYINGSLVKTTNNGSAIFSTYYHSRSLSIRSWRIKSINGYLYDSQTYAYCADNSL